MIYGELVEVQDGVGRYLSGLCAGQSVVRNIYWDGLEIGIECPIELVILSDKETKAPALKERVMTSLNFVYEK